MNLHEYQSKQLFSNYDLPVPLGFVCKGSSELEKTLSKISSDKWVLKTQVHAGGRGKAGGVKVVSSAQEAIAFSEKWLGNRLVTFQTDKLGQPVDKILIEEPLDITNELYLGAVVDRSTQRIVFMASTEGGVDIEEVAENSPEKIHKVSIDPLIGPQPYQGRELAYKLALEPVQVREFTRIFIQLAKMFKEQDLALLEINPLAITSEKKLVCLDAKINVDGNALYRQPELREMYDPSQEDSREAEATEWDLNYVALDGNIGCMVNGAGLAMGTMDLVQLHGGMPANFLDVGGTATAERVTEAFRIILSDPNVRTVLVNIFGGIVRCDLIAQGIIEAMHNISVEVPVIVRLEGNSATEAKELLQASKLDIIAESDLDEAAKRAVKAAEGTK